MAEYLSIHPDNPQPRLIDHAIELIKRGAVTVYPTDSCYAIGCRIGDKGAQDRIRFIRDLDEAHHFTLVCRDLSEIAMYAKVDDYAYRLMKQLTPGPYTFLLSATREIPRRLQNPRRKTIGLRIPDNRILQALLERLNEPLMSTTLHLPGDEHPLTDADEIREKLDKRVDLIIDGGNCGLEPTTIVDLFEDVPVVVRQGKGDISWLSLE